MLTSAELNYRIFLNKDLGRSAPAKEMLLYERNISFEILEK